ncbi:MAG: flippase [Bdellovibrionales bacterium]
MEAKPSGKKNERNSLKKDTLYVYVGHFLKYLGPLILVPYFSRVLGPEGYGQVLAAISLMTMVGLVINFGFLFSGVRDIASAKSDRERGRIVGRQIYGRIILLPAAVAVGGIGTYCSPMLWENPWFGVLATLTGITMGFSMSWFFQGIRQFKTSIMLETIVYPVNIAIVLLCVHGKNDGVFAMLAFFIASVVSLLISLYHIRRKTAEIKTSFREGIKEIRDTTTFFITSMNSVIMTTGATYILSIMTISEQVGYYGTAEKFMTVAIALLNPIGQVLMPTISRLHAETPEQAFRLARKGVMAETAYGMIGPCVGYVLAPLAMPFILGKTFMPSVPVFQTMALVLPFIAVKHAIILYLLIPLRKEKFYMIASVINVCLMLAAIMILVPQYGAMGMAWSRMGAETITTIFLIAVIYKLGLAQKVVRGGGVFKRGASRH